MHSFPTAGSSPLALLPQDESTMSGLHKHESALGAVSLCATRTCFAALFMLQFNGAGALFLARRVSVA